MIGIVSFLAATLMLPPVQPIADKPNAERRCGEACVLRQTYLRPDRKELFAKFPGFEKIDPRPTYKAYVTCTLRQFQAVPVLNNDTDLQIDFKFQNSFAKCEKSRLKGDLSFLPNVLGVGATQDERRIILNARRGQLIVTSIIGSSEAGKKSQQTARIERYMADLIKSEGTTK